MRVARGLDGSGHEDILAGPGSLPLVRSLVVGAGRPALDEPGSFGAPEYVDQPQHEWPHWAGEVRGRVRACCAGWPAAVPLRVYLARGEIGAEISRHAAAERYDAVALVRRSRFEAGRAAVLRAVLDRAPAPVILVGAPGAAGG